MDVTRSNFEELFPCVKDVIDNATFITVDGEFTGLRTAVEPTPFDTLDDFYHKTRTGSKDFLLMQLGICAFRYDPNLDLYKYICYNFYVFPRPHNRTNDFRFLCQSSSIDFLASQGFDFNKVFRDGIPYLTKDDELRLREQLKERIKSREALSNNVNTEQTAIPIPDNDKEFIDEICVKVKEFLESDEDELLLDRCNSFVRRLLYQELNLRFKDQLYVETRNQDNRNFVLVIQRTLSAEELAAKEHERRECEENEITESVGLSRVLEHLANSGKLIVGHNMLLDVIHILKQFFGPLPMQYDEFKDYVHSVFPKLLDTKVLSSVGSFREKIKSSVLGHLLATLSEEPFSIPKVELEKEGYGYEKSDCREHEAGYDAYITGLCLLGLTSHLQGAGKKVWDGNYDVLRPHMNKLFNMRIQDVPYINITGEDITPSREHVFYISSFPKEWKNSEISQLFSPYGTVQIIWLNDSSAFVALHRKENSPLAISGLSQMKSSDYVIVPYNQFIAQELGTQSHRPNSQTSPFKKSGNGFVPEKHTRKRHLSPESFKSKDGFKQNTPNTAIDKYGPSTKISRKSYKKLSDSNQESKSSTTSGVFSVSDDWN